MSKRRDYNDPVYKEFRNKVLKRDKFTCQMCSKKGKKVWLNVHHIMKWSSASALRYDPDNGITLCKNCHDEVTGHESHYISYFTEKVRSNKK
jgi:5-methylcytosine-specific restriction endonuclease McrA